MLVVMPVFIVVNVTVFVTVLMTLRAALLAGSEGRVYGIDFDASALRSGLAKLHHRRAVVGPVELEQLVRQAGFANIEAGRLTSAPVAFVRGTHS